MSSINEIIETFQNRIKSPALGSIFLAFFALNWKSIFYVFFETKESVKIRIEYFDTNTSFLTLLFGPIVIGIIVTILLPVLNYAIAQVVRTPIEKHKELNLISANKLALLKARNRRILDSMVENELVNRQKLESIEKQKILEDAKILDELESIDSDKVREQAVERINKKYEETSPDSRLLADLVNSGLHQNVSGNTLINLSRIITDFDNNNLGSEVTKTRLREQFKDLREELPSGKDYSDFLNRVRSLLPEELGDFM